MTKKMTKKQIKEQIEKRIEQLENQKKEIADEFAKGKISWDAYKYGITDYTAGIAELATILECF
nr:MAG TPA: CdvA-like coiled-coil domain [Caudoviricetes sp.]